MTAQQLLNDLGNDALVIMIMTLVTGLGTGVTVDRISVLHRIDGMTPDEIGAEMNLTPPPTDGLACVLHPQRLARTQQMSLAHDLVQNPRPQTLRQGSMSFVIGGRRE